MPAEIGFRPVTAGDYPLLRRWLSAPHVREWWGDPEEELGFIRDMVEGRDSTRPYLIELGGTPVGYIQVWFVGDNLDQAEEYPWVAELPRDAVGVDLSIGDARAPLARRRLRRARRLHPPAPRRGPPHHRHRPRPRQRARRARLRQGRLPAGPAPRGPHRRRADHAVSLEGERPT